ncbi:capsid protein, partial [Bacillus cereus]
MVMKIKGTMENFEAKKQAYMNLVKAEDTKMEDLSAAFDDMFDTLVTDLSEKISAQARIEAQDAQILTSRGQNVLTSEERKFFNAVVQDGGFKDDSILPYTTQERVFEDLVTEHPLLEAIGMQDLGAVTKFIYSDATKAYAWGELFGDIRG